MTKPLNPKAAAIFAAVPNTEWIDPLDLEAKSELRLGDYYANVAILKRRGLVERDDEGRYRRTETARRESAS